MRLSQRLNTLMFKSKNSLSYFNIWLIFSLVAIGIFILWYPMGASMSFLFFDTGAGLKADYLFSQGYIPTVDFSYVYGLLPLSIAHIWYKIFGRTPQVFWALVLIFKLLSVYTLAKIAYLANLKTLGVIFLAIAIPFSFFCNYNINLTHAIEPFFICLALSEQLAGRKKYALVVLIFSIFTKASLSYFYILLLLILYSIDLLKHKRNILDAIYQLIPASVTFLAMSFWIIINYGLTALIHSLIPLQAAKDYKQPEFGFFGGGGKGFFAPPGMKFSYYIGTGVSLWVILSIVLLISSILLYRKIIKNNINGDIVRIAEVQITTLLLHLGFIIFFFGHNSSWCYYAYLLPIGCSLLASRALPEFKININRNILLVGLSICVIIGYDLVFFKIYHQTWIESKYEKSLVSLWFNKEEKKDFLELLQSCKTKNTLIYSPGAIDLFFPSCHMASAWYPKNSSLLNDQDIARINKQFDEAEEVITPLDSLASLLKIDSMKENFAKFELDHKNKNFTYLKRVSNPSKTK